MSRFGKSVKTIIKYTTMYLAVSARFIGSMAQQTAGNATQWQYTHVIGGGSDDNIFGLDLNRDASGWMVGYTNGFDDIDGFADMLVLPFNSDGTSMSAFTLNATDTLGHLYAIKRITDDRIAVVGGTKKASKNIDPFYGQIQFLNGSPEVLCAKYLDVLEGRFYDLAIDSMYSSYAVGYVRVIGSGARDDFLAVKFDDNCQVQWHTRLFDPTREDTAFTVTLTPDQQNLIICGVSTALDHSVDDWFCASIDTATGSQVSWATKFDLSAEHDLQTSALTHDGSTIVLGGATRALGADHRDMMLATLRVSDGTYTGAWRIARPFHGVIYDLTVDQNDKVYFTGYDNPSTSSVSDALIIGCADLAENKLDWIHAIGNAIKNYGRAVELDEFGGPVVAGYGDSFGAQQKDAFLLRLGNNASFADCTFLPPDERPFIPEDIAANVTSVTPEIVIDQAFPITETNLTYTLKMIAPDEHRECGAEVEVTPPTPAAATTTIATTTAAELDTTTGENTASDKSSTMMSANGETSSSGTSGNTGSTGSSSTSSQPQEPTGMSEALTPPVETKSDSTLIAAMAAILALLYAAISVGGIAAVFHYLKRRKRDASPEAELAAVPSGSSLNSLPAMDYRNGSGRYHNHDLQSADSVYGQIALSRTLTSRSLCEQTYGIVQRRISGSNVAEVEAQRQYALFDSQTGQFNREASQVSYGGGTAMELESPREDQLLISVGAAAGEEAEKTEVGQHYSSPFSGPLYTRPPKGPAYDKLADIEKARPASHYDPVPQKLSGSQGQAQRSPSNYDCVGLPGEPDSNYDEPHVAFT